MVLKNPLDLAEGAGYQLMNEDAQTSVSAFANVTSASIQENLKNQIFSLNGVKGMKFFHQFKNSSKAITQNQNTISLSQQTTQNILSDGYVYLIQIDAEAVDQFKESLKELDDFIHFQPNYRYKTFSTPNTEPLYFRQGTEMDLMEFESDDSPNSWVEASGIGARVAVLDTGIYPQHDDFCGDNGTFNESAQIMDVSTCAALDAPYDFITDGTPTIIDQVDGITAVSGADYEDEDAAPYDKNGHGTHVSGIIGARVNGDGIGGAAYESTILPIRVLAPYYDNGTLTGLGQTSWIVNGINYAVTNNADVINMSLGGIFETADDLIMISAINEAYNSGVLIVAAAGNESV
ncbi:MAG: S8 family serine peptidase, partial [Candidatus Margulisiibacteriota bacterium]|nr:S8 family serine peptidase [Candidatus Margulisiibacteriota bacterium]